MKATSITSALLAVLLAPTLGSAQESAAQTVQGIFRQQTGSIGSELVGAMGEAVPLSVALVVEGAALQRVVENGLIEALSGRGIAVRDAGTFAEASNTLRVLVLEQSVAFDSLGLDAYRRTVRTALEARFEAGGDMPIRYLGTFERAQVDTTRGPEPVEWTTTGSGQDESESTFSRIAAPLVIIAGAALIVYLFFAVRSS